METDNDSIRVGYDQVAGEYAAFFFWPFTRETHRVYIFAKRPWGVRRKA
jgi:hypothetical protein